MAKRAHESDELYAALGKFITHFAEIEHWLSCLLGVLTDDEDNIWTTLFFIDGSMTAWTREKVRAVAKLRLEGNEELLAKLTATLNEVAELTKERNKLIHGQWIFDSTITKLHNYKLTKITLDNGRHFWQRLEDKAILPKHLRGLTRKSEELDNDLSSLRNEIQGYLEAEEKRREELVATAGSAMTEE